ncbi:hypothetical protein ACFYO1_01660 [Nocardia sp. NPDC006044]|uniref:hypothetical protein n=1 Tax=Nocardia sp. NPDC006044 TaxID=3364306 RepID=UPI0036A2CDD6
MIRRSERARRRALLATMLIGTVAIGTGCAGSGHRGHLDLPGGGRLFGGNDDPARSVERAKSDAVAKAKEFYATWSRLEDNPAVPVDALRSAAADPVLTAWTNDIIVRRANGVRGEGAIRVLHANATDASIDPKAWVHVTACLDLSGLTWTKRDGSPDYDEHRPAQVRADLTVRNASFPDPNGWRVTSDSAPRYAPCQP